VWKEIGGRLPVPWHQCVEVDDPREPVPDPGRRDSDGHARVARRAQDDVLEVLHLEHGDDVGHMCAEAHCCWVDVRAIAQP